MTPAPTRNAIAEALSRAAAAYRSGDLAEAERACAVVLAADPGQFDATNLLGAVALARGDAQAALAQFERAAKLQPRIPEPHTNRGVALQALERWDEAIAAYRRALAIDPMHVDALYNLGVVLSTLERWGEALQSYDRVVRIRPDHARAWNNRGNVLQALGRWPEALAAYERTLQLRGDHPELLTNRGVALLELARPRDALQSFERAAALDPTFAEAQWCRGMALLSLGNYAEGWRLHEWRWKKKDAPRTRGFAAPMWTGDCDVAGKTVLLHAEEGFGDAIHMARYAPLVEARGARVILDVYRPLARLMESLSPTLDVVARGDELPTFELHCPLGTLPHAFRTTLETIPTAVPYLRPRPGDVEAWAARLGPRSRPRIGLAWSGNVAHERDRERSIPFERLARALGADFELHALQKEFRAQDREAIERDGRLRTWSEELGDFADTAALAAHLDLVISVDTSVAHLAAAMGKPTWILLAHISDWRWIQGRTDSPWYPTVRLFRQPARDDWDTVLGEVRAALRAME